MRLSGLVVAAFLLISAALFAQHPSATSAPSASSASSGGASSSSTASTSSSSASISHPSSSSSSASSSSSSISGASHNSYSGGSSLSSSGNSASNHSSGSSSSIDSHASSSHASPGSSGSVSSHNSVDSVSRVNADPVASHTNVQVLRSSSERAVREPNAEPKRKIAGETGKLNPPSTKLPPAHANAPPEKKSFFSRFRHPFRPKPVRTAEFKRPPPCRKEPCACPPGESRNGKGVCVAVVVSNLCEPGQYWNGGVCSGTLACQPGNFWNGTTCVQEEAERCVTYDTRAAMLANELRGIKSEMDRVCLQDPSGQRCRELTQQHDGALLRYRMLLNEAPTKCRGTLPDPLSL